MSSQTDAFAAGEGDAWHRRNFAKLALYDARTDPVALALAVVEDGPQTGWRIVDAGCSSGQRLTALCERYDCDGFGIDPSGEAIAAARTIDQDRAAFHVGALPDTLLPKCDVLVLSYVLHWLDRADLPEAIDSVQAAVKPNGYAVIHDFYPPAPIDVPYHHRPGLWTYKRRYDEMLLDRGWKLEYRREFLVPALREGEMESAAVSVLRRA